MRISDWSSDVCSSDLTGFVNAVMGGTPMPGLDRKDDGYFAGVTWQATPRWAITGAAYYDRSKNVVESGDKGQRYALVAVAEYALSKRSPVYATVARSDERRVGKECGSACRSGWSPDNSKKNNRE